MSDSELKSRFLFLHEAIRKLSELKETSRAEFLKDYTISDTVLHNLQLAIEALTDISNYILKRSGHKIPETRVEVFELLCRAEYVEPDYEEDLVEMARFRNLLVHGYAAIRLERVYDIFQERLEFIISVAGKLADVTESLGQRNK